MGTGKKYPQFQDFKGVSLTLVNTEKGKETFEKIKNFYNYIETPLDLAMSQAPLKKPFDKPSKSDLFWQIYLSKGYSACVKKLHSMPKLKYFIKNTLKKIK